MKERINFKAGTAFLIVATMIMMSSSCYYSNKSPGWEYMPDMVHSVAYETYTQNVFFPDSMNAILPVPNTIPRGVYMPFHYSANLSGYDSAGMYLHFPNWLNAKSSEEGKRLFGIYCAVCHGFTGKGDGSIVNNPNIKNPFPPPPSYYDSLRLNLSEGKAYHSVHYGKNLMGPYSKILDHDQLWKIVYYVKSMQVHYKDSIAATAGSAEVMADTSKKALSPQTGTEPKK
jgi:hypothetical protein